MKSLLLSGAIFLLAITIHAQPKWTAVMTQNKGGQAFNDYATLEQVDKFINEQAAKNRVINEVVYAQERWYVVATESSANTKISWKHDATFPQDFVKKEWDNGKYITKITYGDGKWFVIMTDQTPYMTQSWARRDTWDEIIKFAQEKWKENTKFNITDIAYGGGKWYVVMSLFSAYEAQSFKQSEDFPSDWLNSKYKENYNVTSVEHDGEKWHFVMTKHTTNLGEISFNPQTTFPSDRIKEYWNKERRVSSLAFARDPYDDDDDMTDMDWAYLADYMNTLKEKEQTPGKSNKDKASESLSAKNYPEAIRLYKAAITDGNTDETTYNNLAWAQYLDGKCNDALENINKSISVKSMSFNNHTKGAILKCQNKCSDALKYFDEAIRLHRKEFEKFMISDYYSDRAAVKKCMGMYHGAIEDIELALTIEPTNSTLKETLKELNKLAGNK